MSSAPTITLEYIQETTITPIIKDIIRPCSEDGLEPEVPVKCFGSHPFDATQSPTKRHDPDTNSESEDIDKILENQSDVDVIIPNKSKTDLLEYLMRNDGSVVCKLCGEVLQSRTRWYRHKYKQHVAQTLNPSPLYQCEQCLVFFKSRKGYLGHIASRHGEDNDRQTNKEPSSLLQAALEAPIPDKVVPDDPLDAELSIPKTTMPNHNVSSATKTQIDAKRLRFTRNDAIQLHIETKKINRQSKGDIAHDGIETEERRIKEEKLVADIIKRVRRECEAQGASSTRKGYTRRSTVMNS